MKKLLLTTIVGCLVTACSASTSVPMGNDKLQVNVSSAPTEKRASAIYEAYVLAAKATLAEGYDLFTIESINGSVNSDTWGGGFNTMSFDVASRTMNAIGALAVVPLQSSEASVTIRMYRYGDKGSEKALNARERLKEVI